MRGEADNAGDGFLFGRERHGRAAPFAGKFSWTSAWLIFGFLSLVTDNHRQECVSRSDADGRMDCRRCNGAAGDQLAIACQSSDFSPPFEGSDHARPQPDVQAVTRKSGGYPPLVRRSACASVRSGRRGGRRPMSDAGPKKGLGYGRCKAACARK